MKKGILAAVAVIVVIAASVGGYALLSGSNVGDDPSSQSKVYPSSVTITQNDGEKITVATPVEKVAVVNVNAAEFMQVLNVTDRVVGISESIAEDDDFGYIYEGVEVVGTYSEPSGEKILELGANVVIGQCTSMSIKDTAALEDLGITVVLLDCYGLDQITSDLAQLASLFGFEAQERAVQYAEMFNETVGMVTAANASMGEDVTCYMELSNGKAYTSKAEMSSLIDLAGGYNIVKVLVADPTSSTQLISNEAIIAYDNGLGPDFILVRVGGINDNATAELEYQSMVGRAGWSTLNATQSDIIFIITQSGILSGPRVYIGIVYLTETFHPGVLSVSADELLAEYNQAFGYDITPMMDYRHTAT